MQKFNFSYDSDNDDLFLFSPSAKSKGSIEMGDFIFDFNSRKELVGVELMNASGIISDTSSEKDRKEVRDMLSTLERTEVDINPKGNMIIIKVCLISRAKRLMQTISVPQVREPSPALAY